MAARNIYPAVKVGDKFDRLTVVARAEPRLNGKKKQSLWKCACKCGNTHKALDIKLKVGETRSCGCLRADELAARKRTHGLSHTREYQAWRNMINRCTNPNATGFEHWGGKGVTVCARWLRPNGFVNFLADMGPCPTKHSLDRINGDLGYGPENCRWATRSQQNGNTSQAVKVTIDGEELWLAEACRRLNKPYRTVMARRARGKPESEWFK